MNVDMHTKLTPQSCSAISLLASCPACGWVSLKSEKCSNTAATHGRIRFEPPPKYYLSAKVNMYVGMSSSDSPTRWSDANKLQCVRFTLHKTHQFRATGEHCFRCVRRRRGRHGLSKSLCCLCVVCLHFSALFICLCMFAYGHYWMAFPLAGYRIVLSNWIWHVGIAWEGAEEHIQKHVVSMSGLTQINILVWTYWDRSAHAVHITMYVLSGCMADESLCCVHWNAIILSDRHFAC